MLTRCMMVMLGMTLLVSCGDGRLRDMSTSRSTPEEFAILPPNELETPPSFNALPQPTPGAGNRTDPQPNAAAVAALGGDPSRLYGTTASGADAALLNSAQRYGVDGTIRTELAQDDVAYRRRSALFSWRLVKDNEYNRAYRGQRLDADAELAQMRRRQARTPSAPPGAR